MMMEKALSRSLRLMFSGSVAVSLGLLAQPALAQDATSDDSKLQRVEITGSNIKRAQAETASPIQLIKREDIEKSGKATVAEFLQTLTSDGAGSLPTSFGNGFAAGSTAVSLRGLGATSTLVLVNGRRMAAYGRPDDGQKSFTDLSSVPMELVERIEILKDGASSVYGADAIAGVVNIILRKDFTGTVVKAEGGISGYSDYKQGKAAVTHGVGDLDKNGYNVVFNAEVYKDDGLMNKDRKDRDWIGRSDLRPWGYAMPNRYTAGYIVGNNNASPSPTGNVRNPANNNYVSLPGCSQFSSASPQDPNGGCLWTSDQFQSQQPKIESVNLFGRGAWQLNSDLLLYAEAGYNQKKAQFTLTPPSVTPTVNFPANAAYPQGFINYGSGAGTTIVLAANHPQNPFGAAARLRYAAFDVGPQIRVADNAVSRLVVGLKGSAWGWDFDTALLHSEAHLDLTWKNMLHMPSVRAALGDPTSSLFPYYIGAEASRNPAALYNAIRRDISAEAVTKMDIIDIKGSRELMKLDGGMMGLAVGAEYRRESVDSPSLAGTEDGSVNANYVASSGTEKIGAVYAEILAPVLRTVELSAAIRHDRYDNFKSTTPKFGAKWTPLREFALRGTYSEGFRAPGAAESNPASQSTGSSAARDPIRCPNGTPLPGATAADCQASFGAVKVGNPDLKPEQSKGYTLGMIWDPLPDTSVAIDAWKIKRSDEINLMSYVEAARLPTAIRADNNLTVNGAVVPNSGTLLVVKAPWLNSSYTNIRGVDLDLAQNFRLGEYGKLRATLNWTHVITWKRVEPNGTAYEYAGTHGNCDTSNCAGTPKDKVNVTVTWDRGPWSVTGIVNYRGAMKNVLFEGDLCASHLANGADAPADCKIKSFHTVDLSARYQWSKNLTIYGSISNLFDKVAPIDPLTYGAMGYNPMDVSGATGRYFRLGAKYQF
ncbi:MAG TPA: TonB-dependent receptor [Paucimonas sp.]|nr:TonB-dependent receptor [Paucimonas sp.]